MSPCGQTSLDGVVVEKVRPVLHSFGGWGCKMACHPIVPVISNQFTFVFLPFRVLLWLPLALSPGLNCTQFGDARRVIYTLPCLPECLDIQFFIFKLLLSVGFQVPGFIMIKFLFFHNLRLHILNIICFSSFVYLPVYIDQLVLGQCCFHLMAL